MLNRHWRYFVPLAALVAVPAFTSHPVHADETRSTAHNARPELLVAYWGEFVAEVTTSAGLGAAAGAEGFPVGMAVGAVAGGLSTAAIYAVEHSSGSEIVKVSGRPHSAQRLD